MKRHRFWSAGCRWIPILAIVATTSLCLAFLIGCGDPDPTPQVLVVTATFTPDLPVQATEGPQVVVVTTTFTPEQPAQATDVPPPAQSQEPTVTLAPLRPAATLPPVEPTTTLPPVEPTTTLAPAEPTATLVPSEPTATLAPPEPSATAKQAVKVPSLKSYFVVYTGYKGPDLQDYNLWGMNGDGSGAFQIEGAGRASEPAFSPGGDKFAFYHWTDGLYVWDLRKETSMRIVDNSEAAFATWSPNGARLAYANLLGRPQLFIVNADGSDNHPLTPGLRPNWSLKGGFIAYDTCENNKCGIFRINPDGGGKRQLTDDGGGGAAVSPAGNKIAYWNSTDGDFEIYVVNADGSGKRQLTKNQGNDALPAWSPDGMIIYYLSDQNGTAWAVMAMNADGSGQRKIIGTNASSDPVRGWQYQRITATWND